MAFLYGFVPGLLYSMAYMLWLLFHSFNSKAFIPWLLFYSFNSMVLTFDSIVFNSMAFNSIALDTVPYFIHNALFHIS
jgi:hypothetical protein